MSEEISGEVTGPDGNPLENAVVELVKADPDGVEEEAPVERTLTDSNGQYSFDAHPDGDGTAQEWHVSAYHQIQDQWYNTLNLPGVEAALDAAIPDSVVNPPDTVEYQLDAWIFEDDDSVSDGDTISNWEERITGTDISAIGSPTYRESRINENPAVELDGANDAFDEEFSDLSNPVTVFVILERYNEDELEQITGRRTDSDPLHIFFGSVNEIVADHGDDDRLTSTSTVTSGDTALISTRAESGDNTLRLNGSEEVSNSSTDVEGMEVLSFGYEVENDRRYLDGYLAHLEIHTDGLTDSEMVDRENELADAYGLSI